MSPLFESNWQTYIHIINELVENLFPGFFLCYIHIEQKINYNFDCSEIILYFIFHYQKIMDRCIMMQ